MDQATLAPELGYVEAARGIVALLEAVGFTVHLQVDESEIAALATRLEAGVPLAGLVRFDGDVTPQSVHTAIAELADQLAQAMS